MAKNRNILLSIALSILSLILYSENGFMPVLITVRILDVLILLILISYFFKGYSSAEYKTQFILKNSISLIFITLYLIAAVYLLVSVFKGIIHPYFYTFFNITRNIYLIYLAASRVKSVKSMLERFNERPARSIIMSFLAVIAVGAMLLMLPFTTPDGRGLKFIDALFTATSALCVTGLIVVDTASAFTPAGKIIILVLIQTGGLGIMMLSYFSLFVLRRKLSLDEKKRLSFVISDNDLAGINGTLKKIIGFALAFEAAGAALLFSGLTVKTGFSSSNIFSAVFHSVSAFCNAGFSVYSNSLENFSSNPFIIFTISGLIIAGGLSFSVIFNLRDILNPKKKKIRLSLNSKIVLIWTAALTAAGFFVFYAAEHGGTLMKLGTGEQYLAAFFQSVTLRTAGFNTVPFGELAAGSLIVLCFFMFIGAASGSTAGGIKINSMAVITAYLKSLVMNSPKITIYRYQLSKTRVLRAFVVFQFGITLVFFGTAAIALTHDFPLKDIIFEAVSAFGTVGLSTGITSKLNSFGKLIIILLMFNGRLGPLTILSILSGKAARSGAAYPQGDILIG